MLVGRSTGHGSGTQGSDVPPCSRRPDAADVSLTSAGKWLLVRVSEALKRWKYNNEKAELTGKIFENTNTKIPHHGQNI